MGNVSTSRQPYPLSPHRVRVGGFTLVELMVALTLSTIVIAAVYTTHITSSQVFTVQEDLATAQAQLRAGLDQVLADLKRAGFGTTPNTEVDPMVCVRPGLPELYGIAVKEGKDDAMVPNFGTTNPNISPDRLYLSGNFSSPRPYPGIANSITNRIVLQVSDGAAAAGPYSTGDIVLTEAEFRRIFTPGRMIGIRDGYGRTYVTTVASVSYPEIEVVDLSGSGGCGVSGMSSMVRVSPVDRLVYRLVRVAPGDGTDPRTSLIRELVDINDAPIPGTRLEVTENAVDFQVWFMFKDTNPGMNRIPPDPDPTDTVSNIPGLQVDGEAGSRPEFIRSAKVRLSVRTDMEHPDIRHESKAAVTSRLTTFDLDGNPLDGTSLVVTSTGEVEVPNFSLRDITTLGGPVALGGS